MKGGTQKRSKKFRIFRRKINFRVKLGVEKCPKLLKKLFFLMDIQNSTMDVGNSAENNSTHNSGKGTLMNEVVIN